MGRFAYLSRLRLFSGYYCAEVLLPVVSSDPDTDFDELVKLCMTNHTVVRI
ncbi:MAG: hypothetical protein GY864_04245 [Desulfobacterales bacterium]|nr:hypothetical protein [Desulfobacterales bacterium]